MLNTAWNSSLSRLIRGSVASTGTACTYIPRRTDLSYGIRKIHVISMMTFHPRCAARVLYLSIVRLNPINHSHSHRPTVRLQMQPATHCSGTRCMGKRFLKCAKRWLLPGLPTRALALSVTFEQTRLSIRSPTPMATRRPTEDALPSVAPVTLEKAGQSQCKQVSCRE